MSSRKPAEQFQKKEENKEKDEVNDPKLHKKVKTDNGNSKQVEDVDNSDFELDENVDENDHDFDDDGEETSQHSSIDLDAYKKNRDQIPDEDSEDEEHDEDDEEDSEDDYDDEALKMNQKIPQNTPQPPAKQNPVVNKQQKK